MYSQLTPLLLIYKGLHCLSLSWTLPLQTSLLKSSSLTVCTCPPVNPSSTLTPYLQCSPEPLYSCPKTPEDLLLQPSHIQGGLTASACAFYIDGSSFLSGGHLLQDVQWSQMMSRHLLTFTYYQSKNKSNSPHQGLPNHTTNISLRVSINSKYALHVLLMHSAI